MNAEFLEKDIVITFTTDEGQLVPSIPAVRKNLDARAFLGATVIAKYPGAEPETPATEEVFTVVNAKQTTDTVTVVCFSFNTSDLIVEAVRFVYNPETGEITFPS